MPRVARRRIITDPVESARQAGLTYVTEGRPGLTRRRAGRGFVYRDAEGRRVRAGATLARIRALAIPPAWTDVWIAPSPQGHIQALGRDARGRKQYRYHARWREVRDETKYTRVLAFARALPGIRARLRTDLARPGLSRDKVLATVVRLLETTLIRVGNEEYARTNRCRTCPGRSSSSTSPTTARARPSTPRTSTPTCARSRARISRPRISAPVHPAVIEGYLGGVTLDGGRPERGVLALLQSSAARAAA